MARYCKKCNKSFYSLATKVRHDMKKHKDDISFEGQIIQIVAEAFLKTARIDQAALKKIHDMCLEKDGLKSQEIWKIS